MSKMPVPFGNGQTYNGHSGYDFPAPRGTIIPASGSGTIGLRNSTPRGGNIVWVDYDDMPRGAGVAYAHLDSYQDSPPVGSRVSYGSPVARVGMSGNTTGPHAHLEVYGHASSAGFLQFFDLNNVVGTVRGDVAPPFPLPNGWYFGPKEGPEWSVSGFYGHREDLRRWQQRMRDRGWNITPDGLYGDETAGVTYAFQVEKGLYPDKLIGPVTWTAAWTLPVT